MNPYVSSRKRNLRLPAKNDRQSKQVPRRLAEPFERLRDRAAAHEESTGAAPTVFLATLGPLAEVLVPPPSGAQIPLGQLATLQIHQGPPAIKTENARPNAWIYVDIATSDIGGFVRQYQVEVDPEKLRAFGATLSQVQRAIRGANLETSGRLIEMAETEFMVRSEGYIESLDDLETGLDILDQALTAYEA